MLKISPFMASLILGVIVVLFYGNTLSNGFVHDDVWQVVNNSQIRGIDLGKIFGGCISEELLGDCEGRGFYWRPMQAFFNALVYQMSQSAAFFHLMNLVYFWVAGVLVYIMVGEILSALSSLAATKKRSANLETDFGSDFPPRSGLRPAKNNGKNTGFLAGLRHVFGRQQAYRATADIPSFKSNVNGQMSNVDLLPLLAAVIFLAHPINSEAVNWVSATPELLMTVFFLASVIFYLKYLALGKWYLLIISALFWFLALLSKETAVFLGLILVSYWLFTLNFQFAILNFKSIFNVKIFKQIRHLSVYLLPLFVYLIMRSVVLGRIVYKYEGYYALSFGDQILTALALLPRYLLKLIYSLPLSFQAQLAPIRDIGDIRVIGGIGVIGVTGVLGWFLWFRGQRLILFGVAWILVGFLPALLFVNKLGEFILAERYLLVSTVGLAIVVAEVVTRVLTNLKRIRTNRSVAIWVLSIAFAIYFVWAWRAVFSRAGDWKDNLASYRAMIRVNPGHLKAHFQMGEIYRLTGNIELAKIEYQQALTIDNNFEPAKLRLAQVFKKYEGKGLSFYFPSDWELVEKKDALILRDKDKKFEAQIKTEEIAVLPEEYLKLQAESLGKLVNEGPALIPGFEESYVRVWQSQSQSEESKVQRDRETEDVKDREVTKLQFFLFKRGKVIKILASDANSPLMKVFEGILASITIN